MLPWLSAYLAATWQILLELSPSLLAGLFIAGLMHVYLPTGYVHRGLSSSDLRSVMRASLIGVPLPLCSCGVIPAAMGLRNEGASKGAATAFMISTPQTGVDSILVSASFLGWPFALFKLGAAFITGLIGGALVNRITEPDPVPAAKSSGADGARRALGLPGVLRYALFDLLGAIDLWLIAGVLAAALISVLVPPDFFAGQPWSQGLVGMLLVLAISLPLYVCTTASVPIAASLIAAGMPAGSALVFLMAGPATNVATIGAVYRTLGGAVLAAYLGTVAFMSIALGLTFDGLLPASVPDAQPHVHGSLPWLNVLATLVLLAALGYLLQRRVLARLSPAATGPADLTLKVDGMTCPHCVASVKRALEGIAEVTEASPDLTAGLVRIRGEHLDASGLIRAIEGAGFAASLTKRP
jgi:uncharacterized membrane protein YraQ (UPF0718 family)/copper chaperone CopZ